MAAGKTHDKLNLLMGAISCGILIGFSLQWQVIASFAVAFLISTLIFSPDVDLAVNHRVFLWQEQMLANVMLQREELIENTTADDDLYLAANLPYTK